MPSDSNAARIVESTTANGSLLGGGPTPPSPPLPQAASANRADEIVSRTTDPTFMTYSSNSWCEERVSGSSGDSRSAAFGHRHVTVCNSAPARVEYRGGCRYKGVHDQSHD